MKIKLFCYPGTIEIGTEVNDDVPPSTPGFQEVEAPKLIELVSQDPELLEQLRGLLQASYNSGELFGTWETLNQAGQDLKEEIRKAREEWEKERAYRS